MMTIQWSIVQIIAESKMYCSDQSALKLAVFALQAEVGDFDTVRRSYRTEDYLPAKVYTINIQYCWSEPPH